MNGMTRRRLRLSFALGAVVFSAALAAAAGPNTTGERRWAFKPNPEVTPPPDVEGWCANPVDRFVRAKQREHSLAPAGPADKLALLRRITFDLTGLPPTPAEIDVWLGDDSPDAYPRLVERLLASPHYGERWGRHWLDVARYADTHCPSRRWSASSSNTNG
jgi:hypothetical protein